MGEEGDEFFSQNTPVYIPTRSVYPLLMFLPGQAAHRPLINIILVSFIRWRSSCTAMIDQFYCDGSIVHCVVVPAFNLIQKEGSRRFEQ